ncbi:NlpC/P60 family protein [Clostridium saccharoperbutylacetonicum]|uniref:NLP/P60 protein n=1 Tax=Clostridium saccharoperbutylacetonicum N1-4(HMT) TaxID=931276 RepID=M1M155_9CLOT|nr:C40 family peptidase [Clostridium saccharoperbutylacetonicum]AGF59290.1 NLP/P60 protein [Clostridium saccharoperbutylacetonicum N1-4(HMT)]AQR97961.1 putative endopeptidase p60 precursor [Clostridium saccharoperbutylacetonicum]NRT59922.1 cell wall-associated NlpC family hydrolase/outer membrane murein-binding lipoprotein Lpp [Clostridium saccharoperbutylacetonicum]NSB23234.1 cell wall-associated NlpC family hydrolase/outer membrane murein-binding lipoprotein Lpp [Clostridium saccharoperbutyla
MRQRILAIMLASVIVIGGSVPVYAAPDSQQLSDSRQKYAEIQSKITDIQNKIYDLDAQIEPLQLTVDKNKKEIANINKVIDNTTKDIEQCKKDINIMDLALGQRVKEMYKSGDLEFSYLNFMLESESTSDFFTRAEAVSKIVGKDKSQIEEVTSKKQELNDKMQSLEDKKAEIDKLNQEIQANLSQLEGKKSEASALAKQAQDEKKNFDSQYLSQLERDIVKPQIDVLSNSNSSAEDLQTAIDQLRKIRDNQIKSEIVTSEINDKIEKAKAVIAEKKQAQVRAATPSRGGKVSVPSAGNAQAILNMAYAQLGKPYEWGATGTRTFDCSGFTSYVYQNAAGVGIGRTTYDQVDSGQAVSQDQLRPGDLVFTHAGHVGIYVGNGQMIHAPQTGDVVKVGPVYSFYAGRRILN